MDFVRKEAALSKKRLLQAAEAASKESLGKVHSKKGKNSEDVPIGDLIRPEEATVTSGYQASTVSSTIKQKGYQLELDRPTNYPKYTHPSDSGASRDDSFVELSENEVPGSVDIPVSELNDILQAVGGRVATSTSVKSGDSHSSESSGMLFEMSPTPGAGGLPVFSRSGDASSESSTLSVERRLQQMVDRALLPEPVEPVPRSFAGMDLSSDTSKQGTRMSTKRKVSNNL